MSEKELFELLGEEPPPKIPEFIPEEHNIPEETPDAPPPTYQQSIGASAESPKMVKGKGKGRSGKGKGPPPPPPSPPPPPPLTQSVSKGNDLLAQIQKGKNLNKTSSVELNKNPSNPTGDLLDEIKNKGQKIFRKVKNINLVNTDENECDKDDLMCQIRKGQKGLKKVNNTDKNNNPNTSNLPPELAQKLAFINKAVHGDDDSDDDEWDGGSRRRRKGRNTKRKKRVKRKSKTRRKSRTKKNKRKILKENI